MNIKELAKFIRSTVDPSGIKEDSLNDIQVENTGEITKIAVAVDACLATIEGAAKAGAQVLLVHHGLYWGKQLPVTGKKQNHYNRVKALIKNNIGLIASHLPLDAHNEYGNNIILAKMIGLKNPEPFALYCDNFIGFKGKLEKPLAIQEIVERLGITMKDVRYLAFGNKEIETVGIVSGGGVACIHDAIDEGLDLFITGEGKNSTYHNALEGNINVLLAGHYYTETFGVKALGEKIQKDLGIEYVFIDCPTGF